MLLLAAAGVLIIGWKLLWFLTDDSFITFRYVSNSVRGHGYVWNPPPFLPVEGYSSFLWVLILDGVWRLTGSPPPAVANYLTLACSFLSLALAAVLVLRLRWRADLVAWRFVFAALVLLGLTTNRTFLTWASSGFETALFNLLVFAWLALGVGAGAMRPRRVVALSALAACLHLARPEGVLFAAATIAMFTLAPRELAWWRSPRALAAYTPLLLIPLHLLWRHSFYGEWLPNTYYAKVVGVWPASGARYALSFVLEYALWFSLVVMLVAAATQKRVATVRSASQSVAAWICVLTLVAHVSYYTFIVGGDHFEYRVYSHLLAPGFVGLVWLANKSRLRGRVVATLLAAQIALALPLPWSHWALSRHLETRETTRRMRVAVAPHWPPLLREYVRLFDGLQAWLIEHWVCVRHQEHKVNQEYLVTLYPSRAEGEQLPAADFPIHAFQAVGVASWTLPHVNVIDLLGLNDWVIARSPVDATRLRGMAHERRAPDGYADCFEPNVFLAPGGGVRITMRPVPLTAAAIESCERDWSARVRDSGR